MLYYICRKEHRLNEGNEVTMQILIFIFIFLILGISCFLFFALMVNIYSYDAYDSGKRLRQKMFGNNIYIMDKEEKVTIIKNKIIAIESYVIFYLLISIGFYLVIKTSSPISVVVMCFAFIVPELIAFTVALSTKDMGIFANKN